MRRALDALEALLAQGADADRRDGPRWRRLSTDELAHHMYAHALSVASRPDRRDPDTGALEALHVAARALQLAQRAIEEGDR